MKSDFLIWEGDVYRIDRPSFEVFKFSDGKFSPVSGTLVATLEYEGIPSSDPLLKKS